jgi:hypothetical protein
MIQNRRSADETKAKVTEKPEVQRLSARRSTRMWLIFLLRVTFSSAVESGLIRLEFPRDSSASFYFVFAVGAYYLTVPTAHAALEFIQLYRYGYTIMLINCVTILVVCSASGWLSRNLYRKSPLFFVWSNGQQQPTVHFPRRNPKLSPRSATMAFDRSRIFSSPPKNKWKLSSCSD